MGKYVWTRYEPAGSAECLKETVRVLCPHEGMDFTWADNNCDGSVDVISGNELEYREDEDEELRARVYSELFSIYSQVAKKKFDVNQRLADWHRRKGL